MKGQAKMGRVNSTIQQFDLQDFLQRVTDATEPPEAEIVELRDAERVSRTLPALVLPWEKNGPAVDRALFVVTKNLSVTGAALVSQKSLKGDQLLVGLWKGTECRFIQSTVRYRQKIEGGFWQLGVEMERIVEPSEFPALKRLAELAQRLS